MSENPISTLKSASSAQSISSPSQDTSNSPHWLSEERANVYVILAPYLIQLFLSIVCSIVYLFFAWALVFKPTISIAVVEALASPGFFYVIRHYFPGGAQTPARKPRKKS